MKLKLLFLAVLILCLFPLTVFAQEPVAGSLVGQRVAILAGEKVYKDVTNEEVELPSSTVVVPSRFQDGYYAFAYEGEYYWVRENSVQPAPSDQPTQPIQIWMVGGVLVVVVLLLLVVVVVRRFRNIGEAEDTAVSPLEETRREDSTGEESSLGGERVPVIKQNWLPLGHLVLAPFGYYLIVQQHLFGRQRRGVAPNSYTTVWFWERLVCLVPSLQFVVKLPDQEYLIRTDDGNGSLTVKADIDLYLKVSNIYRAMLVSDLRIDTLSDGVTLSVEGIGHFLKEWVISAVRSFISGLTESEFARLGNETLTDWAALLNKYLESKIGFSVTQIVVKQAGVSEAVQQAQLLVYGAEQRRRAARIDGETAEIAQRFRANVQRMDAKVDAESAAIRLKGLYEATAESMSRQLGRPLVYDELAYAYTLALQALAVSGEGGDNEAIVVIGEGRSAAGPAVDAAMIARFLKAQSPDQGGSSGQKD